jgi:MSHA biogenesis protein MshG
MALFHYKGRTHRGDAINGTLEAATADAVAAQLFNSGVTPIEINETRPKGDPLAAVRQKLVSDRASLDDLTLYSRQMYTLMKAGVPIIRAINNLAQSHRKPAMARALRAVATDLESGRDLSGALSRHPRIFSTLFVSIIQVGENTGRLDEAFLQISQYLELEKETRDRIKQAMRYPTVVFIAIAVAIAIINLFVIPAFAKVYAGFKAELPWATQALIATSDFTVAYWPYIVSALLGAVVAARMYVNTEEGRYRWHKLKIRLPLVGGIITRATLARFARSFAMSMRSGVPLIQALTVVARAVDNVFVGDRILQMRNGIERGDTMTRTAAATDMFTPLVLQMMAVGEETGAMDEMMQEVAEFYEREIDYDLKNLSAAIEPILIVAIGAMVLVLALGVFLPMWDLAAAATGQH